jgi:uncharacterized protein with WD repeat
VIAAGTTLCKEHGGQVAGLLNSLMMVTYQKETMLGLEEQERKEVQRIEEEEKRKAQRGETRQV